MATSNTKFSGVSIPPFGSPGGNVLGKAVRSKGLKEQMRIGTWNVRTLLKVGKLEEVKVVMDKSQLDILGICETRWGGNGDFMSGDFRIIHSGSARSGRNGVAIILRGKWKNNVLNTYHYSERIIMIKIKAQPVDLCVIAVYLPTTNSKDEEVEEVYEQIDDLMKLVKEKDNLIVIGDFNASIGEDNKGVWNGKFGLGKMNARGGRLLDFCEQYELTVTNTCFEMPKRRRYTWKSPGDGNRYQIDYILVKKKFMNEIKSSHSYPGYDIDSDHVLVIADYSIRFKKYKRTNQHKWCVEKLKDKQVVAGMRELTDNLIGNKEGWEGFKETIEVATKELIGLRKLEPKKPWMTKEILDLIEERNKMRKQDFDRYKRVKNLITQKCRMEKEKWMQGQYEEIQQDLNKGYTDKAYSKIKAMQIKPRTKTSMVKNKNGDLLFELEDVCERWKEYIEELYQGEDIVNERDILEEESNVDVDMIGPPISKEEFNSALNDLNNGKAVGTDNIPAEILKEIGESTKGYLFKLIKEYYEEGTEPPTDLLNSKTVIIPKKGPALDCGNYRTISLLSHTSKIMLNIIKNRIKKKIEANLGEDQFGFRSGKGTREAILALKMVLERRIGVNRKTYLTFIDLQKAFDMVDWKLLFGTMKEINLDWRDRRLIWNLYKRQETEIEVNGVKKKAKIRRGVRQGCPLSPYLFNLFIEKAIEKFKRITKGIKINGERIHCIRFADDIVVIADSVKEMEFMLLKFAKLLREFNLKINKKKTKTMVVSKIKENHKVDIKLEGDILEQVGSFCYLGSTVTEDNKCTTDIKRRIALAKQAFQNKRNLLTDNHISLEIRKKFAKIFVWSVLTYGCEAWTLGKAEKKRLEAMEMWIWRRMLKTSWVDRKSNDQVLREVNETRTLLNYIGRRKTKMIGHIMRHNLFLKTVFEGKVLGKKPRGRPRATFFNNLKEDMGLKSYEELKRMAMERRTWLNQQGIAFSL